MQGDSTKNAMLGWLKVLDPDLLRAHLINCALFILAYEMFKQGVIGHLTSFYNHEYVDGRLKASQSYRDKVLALYPKDALQASCLWFRQQEVLNDEDLERIAAIRRHRNDIAHELPKYIGTAENNVDVASFQALYEIMVKVDRWWLINLEAATDPDFDGVEIKEDEVFSGNMIMLNMISQVLAGNDEELSEVREFVIGSLSEKHETEDRTTQST